MDIFRYIDLYPKIHFHRWIYLTATHAFDEDIEFSYYCPICWKKMKEVYHSPSESIKYEITKLSDIEINNFRVEK